MTPGILELDLHGKNTYQAKVALEAALRRAGAGTYRIRIIHGYHGGTVLRDMVRREYGAHPQRQAGRGRLRPRHHRSCPAEF